MKKGSKMILCAAVLAVLGGGITSFVGEWKSDATTPDGNYVGADGKWMEGRQAEVQDNQYLEAYAVFLRSYKIPESPMINPQFHLLYIDGDAIPELAISEDIFHAAMVDLYSYNQGSVQKVGSFGSNGAFSYVQSSNIFCDAYSGSGENVAIFYTLQNNAAVPLIRFDAHDNNNDYIHDECYINNIPVTNAVYESQFAAWDAAFTPISYAGYNEGYALNESNIRKMLEDIQNVIPKDNK